MKIRRTKIHFVIIEGRPREVDLKDGAIPLDPLQAGFAQFARIGENGSDGLVAETFPSESLADAIKDSEPGSFIGQPVGKLPSVGIVFKATEVIGS